MRLNMDSDKLDKVVAEVQEYVDASQGTIEDFIEGGCEGWECGDDEQQEWLDGASEHEIASWVIAGLK